MNQLHCVNMQDEEIKFIDNIKSILENSEGIHLLTQTIDKFRNRFPTKWANIRNAILTDIQSKLGI